MWFSSNLQTLHTLYYMKWPLLKKFTQSHFGLKFLLVPDLFLLSISKPVIGLLPSKPIVQRRAIVLSFTSLISTSGGSGGSTRHNINIGFISSCYWNHSQTAYRCSAISLKPGRFFSAPKSFSFSRWDCCSHTLHCELNDPSVFTKWVDGMAGEEAWILPHCGHNLLGSQQRWVI